MNIRLRQILPLAAALLFACGMPGCSGRENVTPTVDAPPPAAPELTEEQKAQIEAEMSM